MRIVFMGTPDYGCPMLMKLNEQYDVVLVVTQPDKYVGRKKEIKFSPIKELALKLGIPVFQPENIREDYEEVIKAKADLIITAAYGQFIPDVLLNYPPFKAINAHASLLPKLRGGAPVHKAITRGYDKTGVTIMYMVSKMDAGDILAQEETPIYDSDNLDILYHRLSEMAAKLMMETLPRLFKGEIVPVKQNEEEATYASNVSKEMERINVTKNVRSIFNLIRGLSPEPAAYFMVNNVKVKVFSSQIIDDKNYEAGIILETHKHLIIGFTDGALEILEVQEEGKKKISAKDYLNGQKLFVKGEYIN